MDEYNDLKYAMKYNPLEFSYGEIAAILAEIEGEYDGAHWHWVVSLNDGRYAYISGGADYTGWD